MAGPWEKYGAQQAPASPSIGIKDQSRVPDGPWSKYAAQEDRVDQGFAVAGAQDAAPDLQASLDRKVAGYATGGARGQGGVMEAIDAGIRNAADAMTFGTADEIAAGLQTGAGMWGDYGQALDRERAINAYDQANHPVASMVGQIGGAVAGGLGAAKAAPGVARMALGGGGASLPARIGRSALAGGVLSGAHGLGSGEGGPQGRLEQGAKEMALGVGVGAVAPVVGSAIGQVAGRVLNKAPAPAPTVEALKAAGNAAYKKADEAGVYLSQPSFSKFAADLSQKLASDGIDAAITPKAAQAAERIRMAVDQPLRLQDVETLRKVAGAAAKSNEPAERYFGGQIKEALDGYLERVGPQDIIAGNGKAGVRALKDARDLWKRMRKGELLDDALAGADLQAASTGSGANIDNATRQRIRSLITQQKTRNIWTPEEKAALMTVVKGTPSGNALRLIGKMAPTGVVSSALSTGAGFTAGGPIGAIALPVTGYAAKKASDAITTRQLQIAAEMIRRGYPAPKRGSPIAAAYAQLIAHGAGQGGVAEATQPRQPLQVTVTRPANWATAQPR